MRFLKLLLVALIAGHIIPISVGFSRDFFLTIAGGYSPQGNQASLEANVLFFQRLLSTKQLSNATHRIYFADGFDGGHDLQVLRRKEDQPAPAIKALSDIFRLPTNQELVYRNHQVPNISGGIRSSDIREGLKSIGAQLRDGDRLFIYVTAHGDAARGKDSVDTSITCWGNKPLLMKEFSSWLDELPKEITVVSIMAQCYCGGFANTIFEAGDENKGFADNVRCGFFAQQADLPAAGCRPDVENDEEYSSYFWGAFLGESRMGKKVGTVDCNRTQRDEFRSSRFSGQRRPRGISARRKVQTAVIEKWPELEDPKKWSTAEVLKPENQAAFLIELELIDGYTESLKSIEDRVKARETSVAAELEQVKFRRLIQQLENVVLAQNIAVVADDEVIQRYRKVVAAEEGLLGSK